MAVLTAFKTGDPNQNGKTDEIPLAFLGPWDLKFLSHAVGLVANDYNIYLDESGTVRFMPDEDGYVDLLQKLSALNAAGLTDPDGFTTADSLRMVTDDDADVTYGVLFGPNPMNLLPYTLGEQYELLEPLTYEGKQVYRDLGGSVMRGAFAITSACDDPARCFRGRISSTPRMAPWRPWPAPRVRITRSARTAPGRIRTTRPPPPVSFTI